MAEEKREIERFDPQWEDTPDGRIPGYVPASNGILVRFTDAQAALAEKDAALAEAERRCGVACDERDEAESALQDRDAQLRGRLEGLAETVAGRFQYRAEQSPAPMEWHLAIQEFNEVFEEWRAAALASTQQEGEAGKCERCGGRGWNYGTEADGKLRCEGCKGTGTTPPTDEIDRRCCCSPGVSAVECPTHGGAI